MLQSVKSTAIADAKKGKRFMRRPLSEHRTQPWKVHEIASDFELDEVWEFPIFANESKGETFRVLCQLEDRSGDEPLSCLAELLVRLRQWLGALGFDGAINELPIPGTNQVSLRERLDAPPLEILPKPSARFPFRVVYDLENERLVELSNSTVHAALHLGWVHKKDTFYAPVMAVYIKPRGRWGQVYMKLIYPFRVAIVYPALMKATKRRWERWQRNRECASPNQ